MRDLKILDRYYPELLEVDFEKIDKISRYRDLKLIFATIGYFIPNKIDPFLKKITDNKRLIDEVLKLVDTLMEFKNIKRWKEKDIRKLSTLVRVDEFLKIYRVVDSSKDIRHIKRVSKRLNIYKSPLKPIIRGKDLISLGYRPSKNFSKILKDLYKYQIRGDIKSFNGAVEFLNHYYPLKL
jgi:tRNA nucleotidyltransferase (CCA-adding enzyme)